MNQAGFSRPTGSRNNKKCALSHDYLDMPIKRSLLPAQYTRLMPFMQRFRQQGRDFLGIWKAGPGNDVAFHAKPIFFTGWIPATIFTPRQPGQIPFYSRKHK
ncbi:hypothetical protein [Erwinia sp. E_sp_W01_6]|uniref:hypothetical protein n=1 Tax=Erwinia sp. E_sp_W01_6 TaxID=3039408 RepID=UPI0030CEA8E3